MLAVYKLYGYKHLLATTTLAVSSSHAKSVKCFVKQWIGTDATRNGEFSGSVYM